MATARYLSFHNTFTPACVGCAAGIPTEYGKPRKPDREVQLVYYVGVAKGTSILADFGRQRKVLCHVVQGVLAHVPPLVQKYSLVRRFSALLCSVRYC